MSIPRSEELDPAASCGPGLGCLDARAAGGTHCVWLEAGTTGAHLVGRVMLVVSVSHVCSFGGDQLRLLGETPDLVEYERPECVHRTSFQWQIDARATPIQCNGVYGAR